MNWGLFLGCKVRCDVRKALKWDCDGIDAIFIAFNCNDELIIKGNQVGFNGAITVKEDTCKPILRSLSSMTEEVRVEFRKEFKYGDDMTEIYLSDDRNGNSQVCLSFSHCVSDATTKELLWLMEKGFYVNQCEPEECILEG